VLDRKRSKSRGFQRQPYKPCVASWIALRKKRVETNTQVCFLSLRYLADDLGGSNIYLGLQEAYFRMTWIRRLFDQLPVTKGMPWPHKAPRAATPPTRSSPVCWRTLRRHCGERGITIPAVGSFGTSTTSSPPTPSPEGSRPSTALRPTSSSANDDNRTGTIQAKPASASAGTIQLNVVVLFRTFVSASKALSAGPAGPAEILPRTAIHIALRIEGLRTRVFRRVELEHHPLRVWNARIRGLVQ
jgi:hypothetical protein